MPRYEAMKAEKEMMQRGLDAEKQDLRQQGYAAGMRNNEESSLEAYGAGRNEGEMAGLGELGLKIREDEQVAMNEAVTAQDEEQAQIAFRMLNEGMDPRYLEEAAKRDEIDISPRAAGMAMQMLEARQPSAQAGSVGGGMPGMEGPNKGLTEGAMRLAAEVMQSQNQPAQGEAPVNVGPLG